MIAHDYEKGIVALACFRAGQRDGTTGMLSIACLLRNRTLERWQPSHYLNACSLVEMMPGFEVDGDQAFPDPRDPAFLALLQNLDDILAGRTKDITNGALVYTRASNPLHASDQIRTERVASLKDLTFYR